MQGNDLKATLLQRDKKNHRLLTVSNLRKQNPAKKKETEAGIGLGNRANELESCPVSAMKHRMETPRGRRREERRKNLKKTPCTMKPNKVVFNDGFPCAVEFCCGSKRSEAALPLRRRGASGQRDAAAEARGAGAGGWVWALATTAQTHGSPLAR